MTASRPSEAAEEQTIHPATRLGHVHYATARLDRQIGFYRDILGFKVHWHDGNSAGLGAGKEDLLRLTEVKNARRERGTTGLYHTAFLVPTRWELAQLLKRIAETRTPIQGMSNHGTHLAIYLADAEDNGIELAWDFPQDQWPKTFQEMLQNNRGLPPDEVFSALADSKAAWEGLHPLTKVGHVHLHVSQLAAARQFYHDLLGFGFPFDLSAAPARFAESILFFSAGGYHHHIGTNVWQGVGAPPPSVDAVGLRYFTVVVPDQPELMRVLKRVEQSRAAITALNNGFLIHDPAKNGLLLTTEGS